MDKPLLDTPLREAIPRIGHLLENLICLGLILSFFGVVAIVVIVSVSVAFEAVTGVFLHPGITLAAGVAAGIWYLRRLA